MNRASVWLMVVAVNLLLVGMAACDDNHGEVSLVGDRIGIYPDTEDPHYAFYTMLTDELTEGQPEWEGAKPLPKSIQELSKAVLDSFVPTKSQPQTGWRIDCIQFKHVPATGSAGASFPPAARKNRWYCEFKLTAPTNGDYKWWQNNVTRYVFLDGTVIKPQRAKSPPDAEWLKGN